MSHGADSLRSIVFALAANLAIALVKFGAAWFTGSGAMLAEAVHSVADAGNQVLLIVGLSRARRPPDEFHPLGYGKSIYVWSFLVAILLFSMGGMFSLYEGWHKLHAPEALSRPWIALGVLLFAIAAEAVSLRAALVEVAKVRAGRRLWRWFRESRQSELIVVVGEDIAALAGLLLALLAIGLAIVTGDPFYDALGTLAIGLLLVFIAVAVGLEVKALLIGQGVEPAVLAAMRRHLQGEAEIADIYNLLTLQLGDVVMVAVKARLLPAASAAALVESINAIEGRFKAAFPAVRWLFFEPDCRD